jgi:3-hydroxybutyryl-CoA dehydratase
VSDSLEKFADQAAMDRWARLSGDFNPIHTDPGYAARTRFGGTILHGHMTVAWLMEWAIGYWGAEWVRRGELRDLRYRRPLRPDTTYKIEADLSGTADGEVQLTVLDLDGTPGVTATACLRGER